MSVIAGFPGYSVVPSTTMADASNGIMICGGDSPCAWTDVGLEFASESTPSTRLSLPSAVLVDFEPDPMSKIPTNTVTCPTRASKY